MDEPGLRIHHDDQQGERRGAMRTRITQLRHQWLRITARTRMGLLIAVVAIAGLAWQHHADAEIGAAAPHPGRQSTPGEIDPEGHDGDAHAGGEYQPDTSALRVAPDFTPEAARVTAERFATNFASPNGNGADWLARLGPDVMPELLDQYRLTDIGNVAQATVAQVSGPMAADPAVPTFEVAYSDGSAIETTLEMSVTGWKLSSVVPMAGPTGPAEPAPVPDPAAPPAPVAPGVIPIGQATP